MLKILQPLVGFNLKDSISNIGAASSLIGSLMIVGVETGNIPAKYEKQAQGLLGVGVVVVGYTTGKRGDLRAGQVDQVAPQFLVSPAPASPAPESALPKSPLPKQ
jgi:hypothetical protein